MPLYEYIWLDANQNIRSKVKVVEEGHGLKGVNELAFWNYDGSSTGQGTGDASEVLLRPVALYPNPFNGANSGDRLVLCDIWLGEGNPHPTNTRVGAVKALKLAGAGCRFGFEQEFFLFLNGYPEMMDQGDTSLWKRQGGYYCGIGSQNVSFTARNAVEIALRLCMKAGLGVTGMNAEVAPSQWELQVCADEIAAGDQLVMLRFILQRVCEEYQLEVSFAPKPIKGTWNGSGCHTNFSTELMRRAGGYSEIIRAIGALKKQHQEHIAVYGEGNEERLVGDFETAKIDEFSWGVGSRNTSIRVPVNVKEEGRGYFEDRRPAANIDPYAIIQRMVTTVCLEKEVEVEN